MAGPNRLVLVDGSSLIFRAYFAIPGNLATKSGLHTNAIFGFATMFRKLLAGRRPELAAVVFDAPGHSGRSEKYAAYKADRPPMKSDLTEQLEWIERLVATHRFPIVRVPGYEADDVIGTLTERAVRAGMDVLIVSGDKDFAQLVGEHVRVFDSIREVTYDSELVQKKFGVPPAQIVDLFALMGDSIDGIPGVAGIGQKGAAALLERHGSLDGILAHVAELKPRQRTALETHRELALVSRELATIQRDVPLPLELEALRAPPPDPAALNALYRELEFFSLLAPEERERPDAAPRGTITTPTGDAAIEAALATFGPQNLGALQTLGALGLAVARSKTEIHYFSASPAGALPAAVVAYLEDPARPKVTHDAREAWMALRRLGVELRGVVFDTQLASFLVDPGKLAPHRLEQVAREYLHVVLPTAKDLLGTREKRPLEAVPAGERAEHAGRLAAAIHELHPLLETRVRALGLEEHLVRNELPLAFLLGQMELDGIRVDKADLERLGAELEAQLAELEAQIHHHAGHPFNIGSPKQLSEVLFEELSLPVVKRTKTGYSTDQEVLERLAPKHEIVRLILEHRRIAKLINTYTNVLREAVNPATGRIHAHLQQTASATGRLISTDPDLQRTPINTPEGRRIRRAFIADPGCALISADWSQIELRLLAHFSEDQRLLDAFQSGLDVHRRTAGELFGVAPEAVTSEQRRVGKTVNFATIYGQGATALGQILGIPRREAEGTIERYFQVFAGVRSWLDRTIAEAQSTGYATTLHGRRRAIPELSSHNVMDRAAGERIAANTTIQGSAADLAKKAMLDVHRALLTRGLRTRLLLQIHDELVFEAPLEEVEAARGLIQARMEGVEALKVPLPVEIGVGPSWGDAHA